MLIGNGVVLLAAATAVTLVSRRAGNWRAVASRLRRVFWTAAAAGLGFCFGFVGAAILHLMPKQANYPFLVERTPLPHHVPQYRGGLSLRFAMVQDVIHERFPKHGQRITSNEIAWRVSGWPHWHRTIP